MISSEELAFVRLAMRKRLLRADQVKEAVERKKWDTPDRSLRGILVDMGALKNDQVVKIGDELRKAQRKGPKRASKRATQVGKDTRARESDDEHGVPGQLGNYKLLKLLGAGAMGAVYDAHNLELDRSVALKLLMTDGAAPSPRSIQRFKREARLAARLDHPNVVRVYEAGIDQGYHFIAMDKVAGHSLGELITLGEMTPRRAVHVMRKVCEAMAYAHEQDVIHRDLKPANILVEEASGEPRVTDFGLAVLSEGGEDDRLTRTGAAVGTPAYMAPEQVRGQLDEIDGRTDIYALGATFYEMLTAQPPFEAPTFLELAKKICDEDPISPRKRSRDVPVDVETICLKALEKRKEDRYQNAAEMAEDLAAFLSDEEIVAQRPSLSTRFGRWARRRPALVAGMVGFLAVVLGATGFYLSLPGAIRVQSDPPGAEVLIDGEVRGTTAEDAPLRIELEAGTHEIRFRKEGYLDLVPGLDTITVQHNVDLPIPRAKLVLRKGLVQVEGSEEVAGARLRIYTPGRAKLVREAGLPFEGALDEGSYEVELSAPGYNVASDTIQVSAGGLERPFGGKAPGAVLVADPTRLVVQADPENVALEWSRSEGRFPTPLTLRGAGRHVVTGHKPGYLPRRRELVLAEGSTKGEARLTLAPLVAARRPLEGRLRGEPVLADVDGDGAIDLLALERAASGIRLVLLPGRGAERALYRVATQSTQLLGAHDLDGDGDLDAVCGDARRLEIREGLAGDRLATIPVDARRASLVGDPPHLAYVGEEGLIVRPLTLERSPGGWPKATSASLRPPLWLPQAKTAVCARQGELLTARPGGATKPIKVAGLEECPLQSVALGDQDAVLALMPRGPARLILLSGKSFDLGEAESRFTQGGSVALPKGGTTVFLLDVQGRVRTFSCSPQGAKEVRLPGRPGLPVVLRQDEACHVWTTSGAAYLADHEGWRLDPLASTDAEGLAAPGATPRAADLDGDGQAEVAIVARDRRALLVLEPGGEWLRWRGRVASSSARSVAVGLGSPTPALALGEGRRVRFLAGEDGRELAEHELPPRGKDGKSAAFEGEVVGLAATPPDPKGMSSLYVAYLNAGETKEHLPAKIQRFRATPRGWQVTPPVELSGIPQGLVAVAGKGHHGVLVGAPLLYLEEGKDGLKERWRDKGHQPGAEVVVSPLNTGGKTPMLVGVRFDEAKKHPILVGRDPTARVTVERELSAGDKSLEPIHLAGADRLLALVSQQRTQQRLETFRARDLSPVAQIPLRSAVTGIALAGEPLPRLLVTLASGRLEAYEPESGILSWTQQLPEGARPPRSPQVLSVGDRQAVAVVAPTGVVLLFSLDDGAFLGERRAPEGDTEDLEVLSGRSDRGGLPPALLLHTTEDELLVVELPSLAAREAGLRQRVQSLRKRLRRGARELANALRELQLLNVRSPDPLVRLAIAEAHLRNGEPDAALRLVKRAQQGGRTASPALQRVRIVATFLAEEQIAPVVLALNNLRQTSPRQAAEVALLLARQRGPHEQELIKLATELDPSYAPARAARGNLLLRRALNVRQREQLGPEDMTPGKWIELANRWWKLPLPRLRETYKTANTARLSLLFALQLEDDPRTRASAVVAAALERAILLELRRDPQGAKGTETRLAQAFESLRLLSAGGPPPERSPKSLELARRLLTAPAMTPIKRAELATDLYREQRDWLVPLAGIQSFSRPD